MGGARTEGSRAGSRTDGPFGQRWSCVSPRCNPAPPAPASRAGCLGELSLGSEPSKRSPVVTPQTNCKPALPPLCGVPRWRSPLRIMPVSIPRDLGGHGGYWRSRINVTPPRPHGTVFENRIDYVNIRLLLCEMKIILRNSFLVTSVRLRSPGQATANAGRQVSPGASPASTPRSFSRSCVPTVLTDGDRP